jgi:hypothetical protein
VHKFVAELYPWATKRFLSSAPLLTGIFAAIAIDACGQAIRNRGVRFLFQSGLITAMLIGQWPMMRDAWTHTEYDGLHQMMADITSYIDDEDLVIVDHFLWATPLHMTFGRQALSGERLWAAPADARSGAARVFIHNQAAAGRRIFFLTGTETGMDVFPLNSLAGEEEGASAADFILLHAFPPYRYPVILHHRNGKGFPRGWRTAYFRLYQWIP